MAKELRAAGKNKTAPEAVSPASEVEDSKTARLTAVEKILRNVEQRMTAKDVKASLGDYIRLIQLSKEMGAEQKTDIRVRWIDREPEKSSEE